MLNCGKSSSVGAGHTRPGRYPQNRTYRGTRADIESAPTALHPIYLLFIIYLRRSLRRRRTLCVAPNLFIIYYLLFV